jgi:hypothetical protein
MASERDIKTSVIGTAKAALVFGLGAERRAIVSPIHAHVLPHRTRERVTFVGPVALNTESRNQVETTVVGTLDRILLSLRLEERDFDVSITNPGASSTRDTGLEIAGYSAELPIFLALISAALQIPLPQDVVTTGHLASIAGDISPVSGLAEKLQASAQDPSIKKFVYPDLRSDQSLHVLTPKELAETELILALHKDAVEQTPVKDIADAVERIFSDEGMVVGSLCSGYFSSRSHQRADEGVIGRLQSFLARNNEARFWRVIESGLLADDIDRSKSLLEQFVRYYVERNEYPADFGQELSQLLVSLPPSIRKSRHLYPLIPMKSCVQLAQAATNRDQSDLQKLFGFTQEPLPRESPRPELTDEVARDPVATEPDSLLAYFLKALTPQSIAEEILLPIDQARAAYAVGSVRVESYDEFCESVFSFYAHLLRHLGQVKGTVNNRLLAPDALDLLERAFADHGGITAAYEESKSAARGGLRYIFDRMTDRLKMEERQKYVRMVFKTMVDPLDFEMKVALMKAFFSRLGSSLPEDIRSHPPEQYATDYELVVRAYADSLEKMIDTLKML